MLSVQFVAEGATLWKVIFSEMWFILNSKGISGKVINQGPLLNIYFNNTIVAFLNLHKCLTVNG